VAAPHRPSRRDDSTLGPDQLDLIVRRLDRLPTLPAVLERILELTRAAGEQPGAAGPPALREIVDLIRADPALTARVLSVLHAASSPFRTVAEAVERIGPEAVRSLLLSTPAFSAGPAEPDEGGGMDPVEFWRHCAAVGCAAELLGQPAKLTTPAEVVYVCGLLHDIGKLALQHVFPKSYRRVLDAVEAQRGDLAEQERKTIGVDHSLFGRRLAEHWGLPEPVRDAIWLHHQPPEAIPAGLPHRRLVAVVALADTLARREQMGFSGNVTFARSCGQQADALGISEAALAEVVGRLASAVEEHQRALGAGQGGRPTPVRELLGDANVELGRINEELRSRTDASSDRAKAFGHLCAFVSALTPDTTICDVLVRAAVLTAAARDYEPTSAAPVLAYSVCREEDEVLLACCGGGDGPAWRRLRVDPPVRRGPAAGSAAETFARWIPDPADLGDWIDASSYLHRSLTCEDRWIGGVLYPRGEREGAPRGTSEETFDALVAAMAAALAMVRARRQAAELGEQLAGASQVLVAARESFAADRTLEAMGAMATGAAHEFNNPLAVISGRAQLMAERADDEKDRATWRLIADQAQRISDIITGLMDFASPRAPKAGPVEPGRLLRGAAEAFYRSDHPKARIVRVDIDVEARTPAVEADEAQMHAAVTELLTNAANAAGSDPRIRLSAQLDPGGDGVLFTVADNGPGMDAKTLAEAFTPFFSSQEAGRRRGLGLPRTRRTVESNGGRIWIRSEPGKGTTVQFQLPPAP